MTTALNVPASPSERTRLLIMTLKHSGTRRFAAFTLANERPADAGEPLAELLDDRNDLLRATAAQLLGSLGVVDRSVFDRLMHTAQADRNPVVRCHAAEALQRLSAMTETS